MTEDEGLANENEVSEALNRVAMEQVASSLSALFKAFRAEGLSIKEAVALSIACVNGADDSDGD